MSVANYDYGIVIGAPRSGTTFIMDILDTVPTLECVSGIVVPIVIPQLLNFPLPEVAQEALLGCVRKSLDDYLESGLYKSRTSAVRKWFATRNGVGELVGAMKGKRQLERVIYKENFQSFAPEFMYRSLPEAPVVYIYRDGRDVSNSLVRSYDALSDEKLTHLRSTEMPIGRKMGDRYVPWWVEEGRETEFLNSAQYVRCIWMWKEMVQRTHDFFEREEVACSKRVLTVKYEDMMQNPLMVGRSIVEHLGGRVTPATRKQLIGAHTRSIGTYKRRDQAEVKAAEQVAGDQLKRLGYL